MITDAQNRFDRLVGELAKLDKKRERKMRQIMAQKEKIDKLDKNNKPHETAKVDQMVKGTR